VVLRVVLCCDAGNVQAFCLASLVVTQEKPENEIIVAQSCQKEKILAPVIPAQTRDYLPLRKPESATKAQ